MKYFAGKKLIWTKYIRIYCDNGKPKFRLYPVFRKKNYDNYWKMIGFCFYLFGREFNISIGKDINNLYDKN